MINAIKKAVTTAAMMVTLAATIATAQTVSIQNQSGGGLDPVRIANDIQAAIGALPTTGGTVTVTGTSVANEFAPIALTIPANVTVRWTADYTNSASNTDNATGAAPSALTVQGNGNFEMAGGSLKNTHTRSGNALFIYPGSVSITVSGGEIFSQGYNAIINYGSGNITVTGGKVETGASGSDYAIFSVGNVAVSGSATQILAPSCRGIRAYGSANISVSGGTISAQRYALEADNGNITVTGGSVTSTSSGAYTISTVNGLVEISGGTVTASGTNGTAVLGDNTIIISGNAVISAPNNASGSIWLGSGGTNLYLLGGTINVPSSSIILSGSNSDKRVYYLKGYELFIRASGSNGFLSANRFNLESVALRSQPGNQFYSYTPGQPRTSVTATLSSELIMTNANITVSSTPSPPSQPAINTAERTVTYSGMNFESGDVTINVTGAQLTVGNKTHTIPNLSTAPFGVAVATADNVPPVPGNSGVLTFSNVQATSLALNWTRATDNMTLQSNLRYYIYRSTSDNISTLANATANGTLLNAGGTLNIATQNITGLDMGTTHYFNVVVEDGAGNKAVYVGGSVTTAPGIPVITTTTLTSAPRGTYLTRTLAATGTAPITWSITGGTLPPGLTLGSGGVISGTPTTAGTFTFTVMASNSGGEDTRELSFTITTPWPQAITVTSGDYTGAGTLWQAVLDIGNGGTITIDQSVGTITLTSQITISKSMTIEGNGVKITGAAASNQFGLFSVNANIDFTVNRVHFSPTLGAGIGTSGSVNPRVNVNSCIFESGDIAAISTRGELIVNGSTFYNNVIAILPGTNATAIITGSVFWGNTTVNIGTTGASISGGYNVYNGTLPAGFATSTDVQASSIPFNTSTFAPTGDALNRLTIHPAGYPALDFNGNFIPVTGAAAGAVQAGTPAQPPTLGGSVTVTGTARFGETLTANTGGLTISSGSIGTVLYQWRRNGLIISGANAQTYAIAEADVGSTITVRVSASNAAGDIISTPSNTVLKAPPPSAPSAPSMAGRTTASITLNAIANAQYRIGTDGAWQSSPIFENLAIGTSYTFYARIAETATHLASAASSGTAISTISATLAGTVEITGAPVFGQTLTAAASLSSDPQLDNLGTVSYQWLRNGSTNIGTNSNTYTLVAADIGHTVSVRVTAANCDGNVTSAAYAVEKGFQNAPSAPTATSANITLTSITLTAISGAEYSLDYFEGWQDETLFAGLTPETGYIFYARLKETATHQASPPTASAVISTAPAPTIAVSAVGLNSLTVGVALTGGNTNYVSYTLSGSTYASPITTSNFTVSGLPAGLSTGAAVRQSNGTEVRRPITGTPTTANANPVTLTTAATIPAANVTGAASAVTVSGTASAGAVAIGTGAAVSGAPVNTTATTNAVQIRVDAITNSSNNGQSVQLAISTEPNLTGDALNNLGTWRTATNTASTRTFTGLIPSTTYYVYARTAANNNYTAGPAQSTAISTLPLTITVEANGLANLTVGQALTGGATNNITYTLAGSQYVASGSITASDFTIDGLPDGLIAGTPTRQNNLTVRVPITGTPTAAATGPVTLTTAASIPASNITGATAVTSASVSGTASAGAVAKATITTANAATFLDIATIPQGDIYNGEDRPITPPTLKSPYTGAGTITVKYNGETTAPKNAGTYTVTADISGGANFEASGVDGIALGSYEIGKADLTDFTAADLLTFAIPANHNFLTATKGIGSAIFKTATHGAATVTVLYDGEPDIPINAGTYEVTAAITEAANFDDGAVALGEYEIGKGTQDAPATVGKTDISVFGANDGKITGVTPAMQYRLQGAAGWTDVVGTVITGLAAGTYEVRFAETDNYNASASETVTIGQPAQTYLVTVTSGTGGGSYAADATVNITANSAPSGQVFSGWTVVSGGVSLANALSSSTSFTMPSNAVSVRADFADVSVTGVSLSQTSLSLTVGGSSQTLTATVSPSNATNKSVTWSSSNTAVATVSGGVVTPVSAGAATITVTTVDGNRTATCEVTVGFTTSVQASDRSPPVTPAEDAAVIVPVNSLSGEFAVGPNPVSRSSGVVNFYRQGNRINNAVLAVYDATGNVVNKISIRDDVTVGAFRETPVQSGDRRVVGEWDLRDAKGRTVPEGAYLLRGTVTTVDGRRERVSVLVGVR